MRFTPRHTELLKFLAVGTVVFFAGSALTTHVVSKLLIDLDSIGASEDPGQDDEALADDDQDPSNPASNPASKPKALGLQMAGKGTYKQASAEAIVASNPFCPSCVPVSESEPLLADASGLPMTAGETRSSLPLQLLATMESDDPLWSMATIRDLDNNALAPYTANEQIRPGVTLLAVERGRVVLLNQGRREYVDIGTEPPPPPPVKPASTAKPDESKAANKIAIEGADEAIACTDENNCTVDRAFVDKLLAKPQQLMSQARMAPVAKDGETAGFRVSGIKTGSLAKLIGLKNGDVVSEINGQRLGNIDDALGMYQKLRRANHLSVTVERGGALIRKEISIK